MGQPAARNMGTGNQSGDEATGQPKEETAAGEETGGQHEVAELLCQPAIGRSVALDPGLGGHKATVFGGDASSSDSDSGSCSDAETEDNADSWPRMSLAP